MAKYGMIIDCSKCIGCYNCFLACQDEFCGNDYPGYSVAAPMSGHDWMRIASKERGSFPKVKVAFIPKTCLHCDNCDVIKAAKNKAVYKRKDGIIMIDPEKAKGQKELVEACPYHAVHWNEEKEVAQKCIMCAHMLDNGEKVPRCVESCPTEGIIFGDLDDPDSQISKLVASGKTQIPHPERGLKAKVRYLNTPKRFIAGTVIDKQKQECASGVSVSLTGQVKDTAGVVSTVTNGFGDFEFEGLAPDTDYVLRLGINGSRTFTSIINTKKDVYLGEINL